MDFLARLHPLVIHFPIALLLAYVLLETIGIIFNKDFFSKTAHLFLLLGVLGLVAAVLTGNSAENVARQWIKAGAHIPLNAIENHEDFANTTLWFFTGLLVLRTYLVLKNKFTGSLKYVVLILAFAGVYFIYQTGYYGGKLVYGYGAGTDIIKTEITK
jgi:uncharacterized membrane protein